LQLGQGVHDPHSALVIGAGAVAAGIGAIALVSAADPLTALGLTTGGVALILLGPVRVGLTHRRSALALATVTTLAGLIDLAGQASAAATAVLLAGAALITLDHTAPPRLHPAPFLAAAAAIVALLAGFGYLQLRERAPGIAPRTEMPPRTSLAVLALAGGTLLTRPRIGTVRALDRIDSDQQRLFAALTQRSDRWKQANARLSQTNRRLAQAVTTKDDLMSLISHELSQPLSSIASIAELLTDDWAELDEETRFSLATRIDSNARRLTRMVGDMLLLFHLESGGITTHRTPVLVGDVVEMIIATQPAATRIVTSIEAEATALVDRDHLRQVLTNLVANAVTHGRPPIEIRAYQRCDRVLITVRDHGSGIPASVAPHLFERSVRSGGHGSGLGLFIARHLVEMNGGGIWHEPAAPHGARLMVRLEPASP
jgi:signal transduction histidine kinase